MSESSLLSDILNMLGKQGVQELGRQAGTPPAETEKATGAAVAAVLRGLEEQSRATAKTKAGTSTEDYLREILANRAGVDTSNVQVHVQKLDPQDASKILRDVFGDRQPKIERQLGKATGVGTDGMGKILSSLAPVILGMLAKKSQGGGGASTADIAARLGRESQVQKEKKGNFGFLDSILDQDHDGDVDLGDVAGMFSKYLGGGH